MDFKKNVINIDKISIIILLFLLFYNHETFRSILSPINTTVIIFLVSIVLLTLTLIFNNKRIYKNSFIITIFLIFIILISVLINGDITGGHIAIILSIITAFSLINIVSFEKFVIIFINSIVFLALFSLLSTYILKPFFLSQLVSFFPVFINSADIPFIDIFFSVVLNEPSYYRNFGIFREPGVYQIFLNLALLLELFYSKKRTSVIRLLILYITILTTFSTPGYIVCVLLLITYVFSRQNDLSYIKDRKINIKYLVTIFILFIFSITIFLYFTNIEMQIIFKETINKLLLQESSFVGRTSAILGALVSWLESPIFGNGITDGLNISKILEYSNINSNTKHLTSTFGGILSVYGLIFSLIIFISFYRLINIVNSQLHLISKIILYLSIFIMFNTQLIIYNEVFYLLCLFGTLPNSQYNSKGNLTKRNDLNT